MITMLRRLRWLSAAERLLHVLRLCVLLRAALTVVQTAAKLWKRRER